MKPKREISRWGLLWVAVSAMIGSGWLFGPLYAAKTAGPAALLSWLIGGFLVMFCVFCFAELSTMLPLVGGLSRFPHLTHGTWVGFTMSWLNWLAYVMVPPVEVQALLQYSGHYLPMLVQETTAMGGHGVSSSLSPIGLGVEAILLLLLTAINVLGVRKITKFNTQISYLKVLIPLGAVCTLMAFSFNPSNLTSHEFAPMGWSGILSALPTAGVIFSFFGFNLAISLAGEVKEPQKTMPFALIGSLLMCTLIYLVLQLGFIMALPSSFLDSGWAGLHFKGESGPFVGLALLIGLLPLAMVLYFDAFLSPFATSLIATLSNARSLVGMSVVGYFPASFQKLNSHGSPSRAIVFNFLLGTTLLLPFPGWQQLAGFIIAALVLAHAIAPIALVCLRKQIPDQNRPFKLPYHQLISFLSFTILNLITYWGGWNTMWKMFWVLGIGYLVLLVRTLTSRSPLNWDVRHGLWMIPYFLGMGLCSYFGSFGGGLEKIPFGWDFVAIGTLSLLVFYLAQISARKSHTVQAELAHEISLMDHSKKAFAEIEALDEEDTQTL